MPIYEYECTECGRIDEIVQKISDKPLTQCRHCSGGVRKLISHSAFHLKGSGWYADNYGNKPGTGSKVSKPAASAPATSSEKKSDS
ncbi:MAG: zinc ribbon domain-containing protein [Desulfobacteraceae bacterium]